MTAPTLSILVVNWNTREHLRACLEAVNLSPGPRVPTPATGSRAWGAPERGGESDRLETGPVRTVSNSSSPPRSGEGPGERFQILVVDNGSTDGSAEMVAAEFPDVRLIRNEKNVGYAPANNQAFALARGEFILLLNPDTRVFPDALGRMLAFLQEHPDAAGCTANLLNEDGTSQRYLYRFPRLLTTILRQTVLGSFFPRLLAACNREYEMQDVELTGVVPVPQPPGACLMLRRAVVAALPTNDERPTTNGGTESRRSRRGPLSSSVVGRSSLVVGQLFDEQFPLLYNDVDLCRRLAAVGHRLYYLPEARVTHGRGEGGLKRLPDLCALEHAVSVIRYFRKHGPWYAGPVLYLALVANYSFVLLRNLVHCADGNWERAWPPLNGTEAQNWRRLARLIANISYFDRPRPTDSPLRRFLLRAIGTEF